MVLHISAHTIRCLSSPFPTISRCFVIRPRVGDDNLDFSGLLIALATLEALCWIMYMMVSRMVSMSSSSSCVLNHRFLNLSWNLIFFDPIRVASTLSSLLVINSFLTISTFNMMLLITILWSLPMLIWLMTVMSGLFARMW